MHQVSFHQHFNWSFLIPKAQKNTQDCLFVILGSLHVKASHKHVGEIDPKSIMKLDVCGNAAMSLLVTSYIRQRLLRWHPYNFSLVRAKIFLVMLCCREASALWGRSRRPWTRRICCPHPPTRSWWSARLVAWTLTISGSACDCWGSQFPWSDFVRTRLAWDSFPLCCMTWCCPSIPACFCWQCYKQLSFNEYGNKCICLHLKVLKHFSKGVSLNKSYLLHQP